jgi:hypothetical protein
VIFSNAFVTIGATGLVRYHVPDIGDCLVETTGSLILEPAPRATRADLRTLIDGGPLLIACLRRGWLPLHASSIEIDGHAVLLAGASGTGKSTMAAALMRRGHRIFADDVSVVDPRAPGGPIVFPGFPHMKLYPDAVTHSGWHADRLEPIRPGVDKLRLPIRIEQQRDPRPIGLLLVLNDGATMPTPLITRLSGVEIMAALRYATFRPRLAELLGLADSLMATTTEMAKRVPVALLAFTKGRTPVPDLAACIERASQGQNATV